MKGINILIIGTVGVGSCITTRLVTDGLIRTPDCARIVPVVPIENQQLPAPPERELRITPSWCLNNSPRPRNRQERRAASK